MRQKKFSNKGVLSCALLNLREETSIGYKRLEAKDFNLKFRGLFKFEFASPKALTFLIDL